MSGNYEEFIEKVKNVVDIVDIITDYIPIKRSGNSYKGLCPFHQEKTPSFTVNPDKQFYYCFGCGAGGDVINFLMEIENITFKEALEISARRAGLTIPDYNNPYQKQKMFERERIFHLNKLTAKFYHYILSKEEISRAALNYLKNRGFTKKDLKTFYLGYAPDNWDTLINFLRKRDFTEEELLKAGLVSQGKNGHYFDRFRDRIIFPIFNVRGEVIAFGGRILGNKQSAPKYLNSPETIIFKKSENLYGLNWAREKIRQTNSAIIMEGYTDILTAHKNGINNTIASLGTAFTLEHARLLKRYANNIYISYDADIAGTKATLRGLEILDREGLNIKIIQLPLEMDPDDFIKKEGKRGFKKLQENAVNLIDFKINQLEKRYDFSKVEEKISFTKDLVRLFSRIDDHIKRDIFIQDVAKKYNVDVETIKKGVRLYNNKDSKNKDKNYNYRYTKKDNKTRDKININSIEASFLKLYIDKPEYREKMNNYLKSEYFTGIYRKLAKVLRDNPYYNIDQLLNTVDSEEIKKQILSLVVLDDDKRSQDIIRIFINKVKNDIYRDLQLIQNYNLKEINQLLLRFIRITV